MTECLKPTTYKSMLGLSDTSGGPCCRHFLFRVFFPRRPRHRVPVQEDKNGQREIDSSQMAMTQPRTGLALCLRTSRWHSESTIGPHLSRRRPVLAILRSARIRNGQPAPLAREHKCLSEPTCCCSRCSPDPGAPGARHVLQLTAALLRFLRLWYINATIAPAPFFLHGRATSPSGTRNTAFIWDPADGQEHGE